MLRGSDAVRIVTALVLAGGLATGGWLMGDGLVRARQVERSVTVRGLAERDVTADLATWTLDYSVTGSDLASEQAEIDRNTQTIMALLRRYGFRDDEITLGGTSVNQYRDQHDVLNIAVRQRLQLRTAKVMQAGQAFAHQADLVRQGVALQDGSSGIVYSFTKLNQIKPAMIAEATRDARAGAQQFARDSGAAVGGIKQATQGYFSIGARDGSREGEGGGSGRDSPFQKVRVVTTVDFYID